MAHNNKQTDPPPAKELRGLHILSWIISLPFVAWIIRIFTRTLLKQRIGKTPTRIATIERAATVSLGSTLQGIVTDVVDVLGYAGAMVATYEQGDSLPVRAFYVDPSVAKAESIRSWEQGISDIAGATLSITDPDIARVYIYDDQYADNLSVQAARAGGPVTSNELYDLFTPIAPLESRPVVKVIQRILGVQQVIAVPFFLETSNNGSTHREMVGNLFAAKRGHISMQDIMVLSAFGRQAAAAIGNERRRLQIESTQELIYRVQTSLNDEQKILERIVKGVVGDLGYVGAMVAPYEMDSSLPVLALHLDPAVASPEDVARWENQLSEAAQQPLRISDPHMAKVYINRERYKDNLSVRAARIGAPTTSNELYDLFIPLAPPHTKPLIDEIQKTLGIHQVVAIPFFLETLIEGQPSRELVGNLFAATRSQSFQPSEIQLLRAFGQQAAAAIRNARLYRTAEERRSAAQMFGRMAFSAATAVHAMANHIGVFQMHIDLMDSLPPESAAQLRYKNPDIAHRLQEVSDILNTLREPWRPISNEHVDVNACLRRAIDKIIPLQDSSQLQVRTSFSDEPLLILTAPDMLTEAFRVLIKNALEAIREKGRSGQLIIESYRDANWIEVSIHDNGTGIKPENITRIFDIGWSTKQTGMGFGLYWTRDYVEGLKGHISVESIPGEGTTFYIRIPTQTM